MDEMKLFEEYGNPSAYATMADSQLRAKLRQAKRALSAHAREYDIDLSASRFQREQIYDRKLGRLEQIVANIEGEILRRS